MNITAALLCASCAPTPLPQPSPITTACTVTDGDTLRCGDERVRLLGIDAPEKAGRCREGRTCAPGDPEAATASLRAKVGSGPLMIRRIGRDRYGRTLALVDAGGIDLSCHQIEKGHAIYVERWDNRRALAQICAAARSHPN